MPNSTYQLNNTLKIDQDLTDSQATLAFVFFNNLYREVILREVGTSSRFYVLVVKNKLK